MVRSTTVCVQLGLCTGVATAAAQPQPASPRQDAMCRRVGQRPLPPVAASSSLDLRLGFTLRAGWELSVIGQNLRERRQPEFGEAATGGYEFERGVFARSIWSF